MEDAGNRTIGTTAVRELLARHRPAYRTGPRLSATLDLLRTAAALTVVLFHLRHLLFVEPALVAAPNQVQGLAYILTNSWMSHQAVMLFFVMSGYLIGQSALRSHVAGRWQYGDYAVSRLSRLWAGLLPALLLGLAVDHLGRTFFAASGVYTGLPSDRAVLIIESTDQFGLGSLVGNALFLQDTVLGAALGVYRFGTNGPLWSLAYEFWFYMMFAGMATVLWAATPLWRLAAIVLTALMAVLAGPVIVAYFLMWLLGAAAAAVPLLGRRAGRGVLAAAAVTLAVCAYWWAPADHITYRQDAIISLLVAVAIWGFASMEGDTAGQRETRGRWQRGFALFAGFSYTLYLVHMPLAVFVHAALYQHSGSKWQPTALPAAAALIICATIVVFAWLLAQVTELRTPAVRAAMLRSGRRARAVLRFGSTL